MAKLIVNYGSIADMGPCFLQMHKTLFSRRIALQKSHCTFPISGKFILRASYALIPLPDEKILSLFKLKAFEDENINVDNLGAFYL